MSFVRPAVNNASMESAYGSIVKETIVDNVSTKHNQTQIVVGFSLYNPVSVVLYKFKYEYWGLGGVYRLF